MDIFFLHLKVTWLSLFPLKHPLLPYSSNFSATNITVLLNLTKLILRSKPVRLCILKLGNSQQGEKKSKSKILLLSSCILLQSQHNITHGFALFTAFATPFSFMSIMEIMHIVVVNQSLIWEILKIWFLPNEGNKAWNILKILFNSIKCAIGFKI